MANPVHPKIVAALGLAEDASVNEVVLAIEDLLANPPAEAVPKFSRIAPALAARLKLTPVEIQRLTARRLDPESYARTKAELAARSFGGARRVRP